MKSVSQCRWQKSKKKKTVKEAPSFLVYHHSFILDNICGFQARLITQWLYFQKALLQSTSHGNFTTILIHVSMTMELPNLGLSYFFFFFSTWPRQHKLKNTQTGYHNLQDKYLTLKIFNSFYFKIFHTR